MNNLKEWFNSLLDIFYPPKCPFCRNYTPKRNFFCDNCLNKDIKDFKIEKIDIANYSLLYLDSCFSICDYDKQIRKIIINLKFHDKKNNAICLTQLLDKKAYNFFKNIDYVVPVPLSEKRLQTRGFNQTELIFKDWATKENLIWFDILKRVRETKPQWQLNLNERKANIKNAFAIKDTPEKTLIKNKTILLVDDIFTSGQTMQECAKALKKAGAKKVIGFSVSKTQ
ncbi:ComF family protein [Selenomonadales bacterium OttesenSCG-928-I06]|nr:ComF family protein [Selenomonadales bacterium OttesenSCG-928-I06]